MVSLDKRIANPHDRSSIRFRITFTGEGDVRGVVAHEMRQQVENIKDNQRALDLAQIQYKVGKIDLRVVEQRQLALYGARASRLQVQSEQLAQRVNLHLALGGSFEPADKTAAR